MSTIRISDEWWTSPSTAESGAAVIVTLRTDLENVRATDKYIYRVEVTWQYKGDDKGLPSLADSLLMEQATDALNDVFNADPVAVMTGIYTGDNERNWVFYTRSLNIFQKKFNLALAELPPMPLDFYVEEDADWSEYQMTLEGLETGDF